MELNPVSPAEALAKEGPPQPPVQPPIPPSPPVKKSASILKWFLIVLAVAAVSAGGGYLYAHSNTLFQRACTMEAKLCPDGSSVGRSGPNCEFSPCPTPTPDPTASWETYQSALLSFRNPRGWTVDNSTGQSGINAFHYFIDIKNSSYQYGPEPSTIAISYWDNPQRLDIPTFQKQIKGKPIYNSGYTPTQVGDAAGYYTKDGPCEPVTCESYTVAYNDKIFIIDLFQPSTEQYRQIVDQILSTFKFLGTAVDTANWKTYTDSKSLFSFQYPPGLIPKNFEDGSLSLTGLDGKTNPVVHEFRINTFSIPTGVSLYQFVYNDGVGSNNGKNYLTANNITLSFNDVSQNTSYKIWEPSEWPSANGILIKFIQNKSTLIWFSLEPYNPGGTQIPYEKEYVTFFDQILSTFTFTQ